MAEYIGRPDKLTDITVAIDKLDKIGLDNVKTELAENGLSQDEITRLEPVFAINGDYDSKLAAIKNLLKDNETGLKGVEELEFVLNTLHTLPIANAVDFDLTLARGLNYYTGCIFEVKALDVQIGSITGGGRYDNLTGIFGMPGLSGVGISFGADPKDIASSAQLLFINFGPTELTHCIRLAALTRQAGIRTEVYPDSVKMKKQMSYASNSNIPFVALVGEDEIKNNTISLKNMETGEQKSVTVEEAISIINA